MLVKEIKENFKISTEDRGKSWQLYSKDEHGIYNVNKYLCTINKVKRNFYCVDTPDFEPTKDITTLLSDVEKYLSSLKYNSEFYNPLYREGYFEEIVVTDYMRKIGFNSDSGDSFTMERKDVYGGDKKRCVISIDGLNSFGGLLSSSNEISENVKIILWTGDSSWISSECKRNSDDIIKHINSILKPLFLANSVTDFVKQKEFALANVEIDMNEFSLSSMENNKKPYKEEMISSLEEMLKELKNE